MTTKSYLVQVSGDGEIWETVYKENAEVLRTSTNRFAATQARWVRLFFTGKDKEEGYSIYEFAVYH